MRISTQHISSAGSVFKRIGHTEASLGLGGLLQQVSSGVGRVEIVGPGDDCSCVLLSKTELESLERALSILSGTRSAQEIREQIDAIASTATAQFVEVPAHVV